VRVRLAWTGLTLALLIGLVLLYLFDFLTNAPAAVSAAVTPTSVHLTLQTDPAYGHAPDPDWVTYEAQSPDGSWHHTTIVKIPAHRLITVTIYQYDTASGLRNPFFAKVRGTTGGVMQLNGTPTGYINGNNTAHTFTVPDLGINIPLQGVNPNAKNQCSASPCTLAEAHNTITFTFMSPGPGTYRFQCFVPCAAAFLFGNGGPMQTIGWMDGELEVQ
jgi:hypothetical protein